MNEINPLVHGLLRQIRDGVIYAHGNADRQATEIAHKYVTKCWESGDLPCLLPGKKNSWIVGFAVGHSFFQNSVSMITVGPNKPSSLKKRHIKVYKIECP